MSKEALKAKTRFNFDDLKELVEILCAPDGCPWDHAQTHQSIRNNFIEETYEVVEGIDTANPKIMQEELGDVLLQVIMHCSIAERSNEFTLEDVLSELCTKLIFRHPHLFADNYTANTADDALNNWEQLKKKEKGFRSPEQVVSSVSPALPALMRAQKLSAKAQKNGLIDSQSTLSDVEASFHSFKEKVQNGDAAAKNQAIGDLLFSICSLGNTLDLNVEQSLFGKNAQFCEEICAK